MHNVLMEIRFHDTATFQFSICKQKSFGREQPKMLKGSPGNLDPFNRVGMTSN